MGVLRQEEEDQAELDILVTDDRQIARYHQRYLGVEGPTDVMAFGMREGRKVAGNKQILGDVVLSAETAKKMAKKLRITVEEEIERYLIHGILHLLGYRDHSVKAARQMHQRQEELLRQCRFKKPRPLF